jgi:hypothetical protein
MKAVRGGMKDQRPKLTPGATVPGPASSGVEVHVIFTTPHATRAALQVADAMVQSSEVRIHFLVPQVVPLWFPLTKPPISMAFAEQRALDMVFECCSTASIRIQVVLCGNREQCIERILSPNSLVIIGSRRQRWLGPEQKLAKQLRAKGHRVIHVLEQ